MSSSSSLSSSTSTSSGSASSDSDSSSSTGKPGLSKVAGEDRSGGVHGLKKTRPVNVPQKKQPGDTTSNTQSKNASAASGKLSNEKSQGNQTGGPSPKLKAARQTKAPLKKSVLSKATIKRKSSEESQSESASLDSVDESSTSSDSEASDSSNSFESRGHHQTSKDKRTYASNKLTHSDSDDIGTGAGAGRPQDTTLRKLTRMSVRRNNSQRNMGGSESESDTANDNERSDSKSPAKKPIATTKSKVKNPARIAPPKRRSVSPLQQIEKKCPIEGCDSSGHLSGNLDRHFLPEACPIFHNMSASECKERANERKQRNEHRQKMIGGNNSDSTNTMGTVVSINNRTAEQKEFLNKIKESRLQFKPCSIIKTEKAKIEKDCTDEDREPSLMGLVPDYDLQLFREAQAIASEKIEDELKDLPVGKGIKYITMGKYKMKVWYQSPYPDDAARLPKMYICEFCLRYQKSKTGIKRHAQKCVWRHPPGDEIYRKGKLQVWQVDGKRHKQYCQHLCLLAKFFLDHKTLYYDVEPFLFYIMTLADVDGCHTVGYFSKEKNSFYNVSCILTLPPYQRKGYGRLLIDFSYLLTRVEGKIGSPEKPLSDLGLISYRSYWKDVLLDYLCSRSGNTLSIKEVSQEMAIYSYDIVSTLQALGMMKYWKGKHIVLKKQDVLDEYEERVKHRGNFPKIDDMCLRWRPFVPPQTNGAS